jgi:hypothetical protein
MSSWPITYPAVMQEAKDSSEDKEGSAGAEVMAAAPPPVAVGRAAAAV